MRLYGKHDGSSFVALASALALVPPLAWGAPALAQQVDGAGAPYEPVTLTLEGPQSDERSGANPFADICLNWIVSNGETSWTVPGYFAGCGTAADNGCTAGNLWRAHFVPPEVGSYSWQVSFASGPDIALTERVGEPRARHFCHRRTIRRSGARARHADLFGRALLPVLR